MLSSQINDHLFPKVTAETILVQSKSFRKQGKHITKCPKCEQTGGGTEHSRSSLEKILTLLLFRGLQRLVLKGATDGEGFCPVYSHPALGMGVGVRGTEAFANFLAEIITDQTILSSPPQ